jgi:hypothetical protein
MFGHHLPGLVDLGVEGGDQPYLGGHDRVGGLYRPGLRQLGGAQLPLQVGDLGLDAAAVRAA